MLQVSATAPTRAGDELRKRGSMEQPNSGKVESASACDGRRYTQGWGRSRKNWGGGRRPPDPEIMPPKILKSFSVRRAELAYLYDSIKDIPTVALILLRCELTSLRSVDPADSHPFPGDTEATTHLSNMIKR
jgi:hypothetical protein